MKQREEILEIDLWRVTMACLRRWWLIMLVGLLGGTMAFSYTKVAITPTYESTVKIYVNNSEINVGNLSITASDLNASSQLVDIYEVILNTTDTMNFVIQRANLNYTPETLMKMLRTSSVNDTQVFRVTATSTSPQEAKLIASTIGDVLPDVIGDIINSADARIVEHASVPTQRSAPSFSKNVILGAMLGALLAILFICVREVMDITIKNEDDLQDLTDIPILTYIPDLGSAEKKRYGYQKNYHAYERRGDR